MATWPAERLAQFRDHEQRVLTTLRDERERSPEVVQPPGGGGGGASDGWWRKFLVVKDGGGAGGASSMCSYTYSIWLEGADIQADPPLATEVPVLRARAQLGAYRPASDGTYGLGFAIGEEWYLAFALDEQPLAERCDETGGAA